MGDRRFKGRGGYPMETSYHFIHQNTKNICWFSIFREVLHEVATKYCIPYSGKLSREKTFAFFAVSEPSVKVFSAKFCNLQCARCVYAGVLRMQEYHTYIIIGPEQSAKVLSVKFLFCTETRKFSPSKVFLYTGYHKSNSPREEC